MIKHPFLLGVSVSFMSSLFVLISHETTSASLSFPASRALSTPHVAQANLPYGPDTCVQGYVWREAVEGDHVCVLPETREQARLDNSQAHTRRQPGGGDYGPDTCIQGYVWREAVEGDHVCVLPQTRAQAWDDNAQAEARFARNQDAATLVVRFSAVNVRTPLDGRGGPSAELYAKVKFPEHDWLQTDVIGGDNISPGDRWTISRSISNYNSSLPIEIEVWDEDRGIQGDDNGLSSTVVINPRECSYGLPPDKVALWGEANGNVCIVSHRLGGSHLTADVVIEAHLP